MTHEGGEGPDPAEALAQSVAQLVVYRAVLAAMERPVEVLELAYSSEDTDDALLGVQSLLGVDKVGAQAVLDMQFFRVTAAQRHRLRDKVTQLESVCERLRAGATG